MRLYRPDSFYAAALYGNAALADSEPKGLPWMPHDGGRAAAGFKGVAGDCVVRAVAIASGRDYLRVYNDISAMNAKAGRSKSARNGVHKEVYKEYIEKQMEWAWVPTMGVGTGCTVRMSPADLPLGKLIVRLSGHLCAVIDGVSYDLSDPSRGGSRCVYGYWKET